LRFLLDQNLPVSLIDVLAELGHEALHVKPLGLSEATDREVWARARTLQAVMVSKDSDFIALAGRGGRLVRLRIGNRSNADLFAVLRASWPGVIARLEDGDSVVDVHGELAR